MELTEKEIRLLKIATRNQIKGGHGYYGAARFTMTAIVVRSSMKRESVGPIMQNLKEKGVIREMVAQHGSSGVDTYQINQLVWPDVSLILKAHGRPEPSRLCDYVTEFHKTYECPIGEKGARFPGFDRRVLRRAILIEEFDEYVSAEQNDDMVEIADALADIVYIAMGTALEYGINLDAVLAEVHSSNMSKLGEDGKPIIREDGKVLKGPNYFKPNIARVLGLQSTDE